MALPIRPGRKGCSFTRTPEQVRWDWVKLWLGKAEKALKALLIRHQIAFTKTHNLGELLRLAEPVAPGISKQLAEAELLTPYAVDARYPSEQLPVDRREVGRHLAVARKVLDTVSALLKPYLDAGRPGG